MNQLYSIFLAPFCDVDFMWQGLLGTSLLAVSSSPTSMFLVARRMSLSGDALAHALLPGAALGYVLGGSMVHMRFGAALVGVVVAALSGLIARFSFLKEEAALAGFYLISLAAGLLIINLYGSPSDLMDLLLGDIVSLNKKSLVFLGSVMFSSLLFMYWLYPLLLIETFDSSYFYFLKRGQFWRHMTHMLFILLVIGQLISGLEALGSLMAIGVMILPALIVNLWTPASFGQLCARSISVSIPAIYIGLLSSYYSHLPAGPLILLTLGTVYILSITYKICRSIQLA